MKNILIFSLFLISAATLTAQTELDSIVIVENKVIGINTFNCEQLSNYRYDLNTKYHENYSSAIAKADEMSKEVSPCYSYKVTVEIKRRLGNNYTIAEKDCILGISSHSVYAQDYTFYLIKERSNPLYAQKTSGSIICDYDIEHLPDNR